MTFRFVMYEDHRAIAKIMVVFFSKQFAGVWVILSFSS